MSSSQIIQQVYFLCQDPNIFHECMNMIEWYMTEHLQYKGSFLPCSTWNKTMNNSTNWNHTLVIVFGLHAYFGTLPSHYTAYQLEQLSDTKNGYLTSDYLYKLRQADEVWDYSHINFTILTETHQLNNVYFVPLGHYPSLFSDFQPFYSKSCDICFLGNINTRRQYYLDTIDTYLVADKKQTIQRYSNIWGKERNQMVQQAGILLNIHFFQPSILEITRLLFLLANGAEVISETSSDPYLDELYSPYITFCSSPRDMANTIQCILSKSKEDRTINAMERVMKYKNNLSLQFSMKHSPRIQSHLTYIKN